MALSGVMRTNDYDGRYYELSWTATQSTINNTSTISWTLKALGGRSHFYTEYVLQVMLGGNTLINKTDAYYRQKGTIKTGSFTLTHNLLGELTINGSIKAASNSVEPNLFGNASWELNKIPRQATITAAPNFTDEDNPTITYSNLVGNDVSKLEACISLTGENPDIAYRDIPKAGTTYTFNFTDSEREILRNSCVNAKSRDVYFYIRTTIGSTVLRYNLKRTLTIVNADPTVSATAVDQGTVSITLTGDTSKMIKGYNTINVSMTATAKKGATISSYKITNGSNVINTASGLFNNAESGTFVFTATDSRGYSSSKTVNLTVIPYVPLTCNVNAKIELNATDSTKADITFEISGNYYNGSFGAKNNTLTLAYELEAKSGKSTEVITTTPTFKDNTYKLTYTISNLSYQDSYTVIIKASDLVYQNVSSTSKKLSVFPVYDWSETDFRHHTDVILSNGKAIQGIGVDGTPVVAFEPCDSSGNTVLGYGNYSSEIGSTNIYGTNVGLYAKDKILINGREYGQNAVLWSGAYSMDASQTITLAKPISEQPNGIILVFSLYRDGSAVDDSICTFFVSKKEVELMPDAGHTFFLLINSGFSVMGAKYLNISDTQIKGNATNATNGTNNNMTFTNTSFVLRYVLGV